MTLQVFGHRGPPAAIQVGGTGDDRVAEGGRQAHGDHVGRDELAQADSGVEPVLGQVDEFLAGHDLHHHVGTRLRERGQDRLHQQRHHGSRHREAQEAGRPVRQSPRRVRRGHDLVEARPRALQESLARFRQADAARRAREQCDAESRLQGADGLADRRGRDPEVIGGLPEAATSRHAQECLDALQRAPRDCVALLHGS